MPHVVCEPCYDCKYTDCVVVCPVECFYQDDKMLYIHPDDCINCENCVVECPVHAIYNAPAVPKPWEGYIQLNADRARALKTSRQGHIDRQQDALKGPLCGTQTRRQGDKETRREEPTL